MGERVFVVGVGMTDFVKPAARPGWDYPDMASEAGSQALADAGVPYERIEHVAVGYCFGDTTAGQRAVYELGHTGVPVVNVNNACATGSTARAPSPCWRMKPSLATTAAAAPLDVGQLCRIVSGA